MTDLTVKTMFQAIREGNVDSVQRCLAAGISPNIIHENVSALYWAARWGHIELVKLLHECGAMINRPERHYTALRGALVGKHADIVKFLVENGADATTPDQEGLTALHQEACQGGKVTVQLLLRMKAKVDAVSDRGETSLQIAAECGNLDIVTALAEAGANPFLKNHEGLTPRELAHRGGYSEIESLLQTYEAQRHSTASRQEPASKTESKKGGCYIATACYGSYDHPDVKVLRRFRDERLLTNPAGTRLVHAYYTISPLLARSIGNHRWLSTAIRRYLLEPAVRALTPSRKPQL